jgi:prolyl-tRNA synthetase
VEVGPRDVDGGTFILKQRLDRSKVAVAIGEATAGWLSARLADAHNAMFAKAKAFRDANIRTAGSYEEMKKILTEHGGFVRCYFQPDKAAEARIKEETKATVRCIPFEQPAVGGTCIASGQPTKTQVLFAVAY